MRILAIESSTRYASAAVVDCTCPLSAEDPKILSSLFSQAVSVRENASDFQVLAQCSNRTDSSTPDSANSSSVFIPIVKRTISQSGTGLGDVDLISVSLGPGSFTGLRIGVVTAKSLAYALNCDVVGVNVCDALACESLPFFFDQELSNISIGINIGRQEIQVTEYLYDEGAFEQVSGPEVMKPENWFNSSRESKKAFAGSGIKLLNSEQQSELTILPDSLDAPSVVSIAKLGMFEFLTNGSMDLWGLEPIYSRPSAAEENRVTK